MRQVRRVLGEENLALSVMSQNLDWSRGYFGDARQVFLPDIYPPFLFREVRQHHGVIACEGSMFKSKFADALTTMFIGALGIAAAENKLSVGYGAEAGYMNPMLEKMCARYCRRSLIITRNEESQAVLSKLGVASEAGTDTAWTFEPLPPEYGRKALIDAGWDGHTPVLAVCPINPFWWPVTPSTPKFVAHACFGAYKEEPLPHDLFSQIGPQSRCRLQKISCRAGARVKDISQQASRVSDSGSHGKPRRAGHARRLAPQLGDAPVFSSDDYNMYQMVSILRCASLMVSSRYHANGYLHACPGAFRGSHDGRTYPQPASRTRPRGSAATVEDPDLGEKLSVVMERWPPTRIPCATHRSLRRSQFQTHGPHGSIPGTGPSAISGLSVPAGVRIGRSICRRSARTCAVCWARTKARRPPLPGIRLTVAGNRGAGFSLWGLVEDFAPGHNRPHRLKPAPLKP